jgi:hypothetical protein
MVGNWSSSSSTLDVFYPAEGQFTITSNTSGATTANYFVQAAEWGRQAGEQWVEDIQQQWIGELENQVAIQGITVGGPGPDLVWQDTRTPEQIEEDARRAREAEYASDSAKWRAREILLRHLTPKQAESYLEHGHFDMKTHRGHRYRIGNASCQNVLRLNRRGKPMRCYCVTVAGVPVADTMLAQLLMLQADEEGFLKTARQWPVRLARGLDRPPNLREDHAWIRTAAEGLLVQNHAWDLAEAA